MQQSRGDIFNSAHLDPTDSVEFCGACHGTWWDVKNFRCQRSRHHPFGTLPASHEQVLGQRRRAAYVYCLPRSSRATADRFHRVRSCLSQVSRKLTWPKANGEPSGRSLRGRNKGLHLVSYAKGLCPGDAQQLHRSSHSHCAGRGTISGIVHHLDSLADYFHLPVPSTIVTYRSIGRSVNRSTAPPGCGQ